MRKRSPSEGQASLFDRTESRGLRTEAKPKSESVPSPPSVRPSRWTKPVVEGRTVAEIRLRWTKRLTPAQVGRVEAELGTLPQRLTKLGFGTVQVERTFVRRRKS
jgi:hypothetical protein